MECQPAFIFFTFFLNFTLLNLVISLKIVFCDKPPHDSGLRVPVKFKFTSSLENENQSQIIVQILNETIHLTPVKKLSVAEGNVQFWKNNGSPKRIISYEAIEIPMKKIGQFYQNEKKLAALTISLNEDGNIVFHGTFGLKFGVKPSLKSTEVFSKSHSALDKHGFVTTVPHDLFEITRPIFKHQFTNLDARIFRRQHRNLLRSPSEPLEIVYPQLLVITDEKFRSHFHNEIEISRYIVSFWESVNQVYSQLSNPRVKLYITDIFQMDERLVKESVATFTKTNYNLIHDDLFLNNTSKYLFESLSLLKSKFDVAIVMTGRDMIGLSKTGFEIPEVLGYARNGEACNFPQNVVAFTDNGNYRTIFIAAHELAHTFGVKHATTDLTQKCVANDENIMADRFFDGEIKQFSMCSEEEMQRFFNSEKGACLRNVPFSNPKVDESKISDEELIETNYKLQNKNVSANEQCRRKGAFKATNPEFILCLYLQCTFVNTDKTLRDEYVGIAEDGTPCNNFNWICKQGFCTVQL